MSQAKGVTSAEAPGGRALARAGTARRPAHLEDSESAVSRGHRAGLSGHCEDAGPHPEGKPGHWGLWVEKGHNPTYCRIPTAAGGLR